jgi:hypothetical protein
MEGAAMKLVGKTSDRFGRPSHASIVEYDNGSFGWFFHPPAMDLVAASKRYLPNGPFKTKEEAENNFLDVICGGRDVPVVSDIIQRRCGDQMSIFERELKRRLAAMKSDQDLQQTAAWWIECMANSPGIDPTLTPLEWAFCEQIDKAFVEWERQKKVH